MSSRDRYSWALGLLDWLLDVGWIFALAACVIVALIAALVVEVEQRQEFMAECLEHRERYECVAMWRAGDRSTVVPVVTSR